MPVAATRQVDYPVLAEFRYQIRLFLRRSEDAARAAGLEPQHHQLLLALKGAADVIKPSIAWLAERLQLQHHSVVGLVDRLVSRRLVRRHRDPTDHRRVVVSLTRAGEVILHDLSIFHQDELRQQAGDLIAALERIVHPNMPL
jgi:DNA-binding MarR family transcriptional regulator